MRKTISKRKNIRLKEYDYSMDGYYFITICIKNRLKILGKINVGVALQGDPKSENVILSEKGKVVKKHIENCEKIYDNVRIDDYIIMPNHIHLIIELANRVAQECDLYNS